MPSPYEMIISPFEVYITTGTDAFPVISATPSGGWVKLGTNGKNNQAEGGVEITHTQTMNYVRVEGRTGPAKAYRTQEDQAVRFTLYDLSKSVYKVALSGDAPTADTSTQDSVGLSRSENVREMKMLIRGASPVGANIEAQYELPRVVHSGSPTVKLTKNGPAGIEFNFMTLEDLSASTTGTRFGSFRIANS